MNKKLSVFLFALLFTALACGGTVPTASGQPSVETIVAATLQAATSAAQQSGVDRFTYQNVGITIPAGLSDTVEGKIVPAADETMTGPWGVAPEYVELVLANYPIKDENFLPVIRVYPAQEYAAVNSWANTSLGKLQVILANPSLPLTNKNLSTIPFNGAAEQNYAAQAKLLSFNNGNGVRMISQYGQFPGHVLKDASFYHYEGLTKDGKYLVSVMLPVRLPLQSTAENPNADGVPYPSDPIQDENGINAYYQGITDILDAASPDSFQPDLTLLDALVQSIEIK